MFIRQERPQQLGGFFSRIAHAVQRTSPTAHLVKRITGASGKKGFIRIAEKIGPASPSTRLAQRRFGLTREQRAKSGFNAMKEIASIADKLTPKTTRGKHFNKAINPVRTLWEGYLSPTAVNKFANKNSPQWYGDLVDKVDKETGHGGAGSSTASAPAPFQGSSSSSSLFPTQDEADEGAAADPAAAAAAPADQAPAAPATGKAIAIGAGLLALFSLLG